MNKKKMTNDLLSISHDDDNENYESFQEFLKSDTERKKQTTASLIFEKGDELLEEINEKEKEYALEKEILIEYIIKKSKTKIYKKKSLMKYDIRDVREIYSQIKYENRGIFIKLLEFFNLFHH
ncbi:MAG: hypothetical protein ACOC33_01000 [bacterium]